MPATASVTERPSTPTPSTTEPPTSAAPATPAQSPATPKESAPEKQQPTPATTDRAASENVSSETKTETTAAESQASTAPSDTPAPDLESLIENADPKTLAKLARNPKLAGHIGTLAQRQARVEAQRILAEQQARAQQEQLQKLAESDPYAYVQEQKRIQQEQLATANQKAAVYSELDSVLHGAFYQMPEAARNKIAGRSYTEGTEAEQRLKYLTDYGEAMRAFGIEEAEARFAERLKAEKAKWEKDEVPALRKQVLTETNGAEPSPDTGSGAARNGTISQAEWDRNRKDRDWRTANWDAINKSVAAGIIRH